MKDNNLIKNMFYNTYGTFFYFFCQWFITVLVVRLSGYEDAGVLALIISTVNLFYCVALFGVRSYQISDIHGKHNDNEYIYSRIITSTISLIIFLFSLFFLNFETKTLYCSIVYIFYKIGESFSDVFFGSLQKYGCYKQIAISYTLKGILTVVAFWLILLITNNLLLALFVNVFVYLLTLFFYDMLILKRNFRMRFMRFEVKKLLIPCFPLMMYGCMVPYLNFITRFVVEKYYGTEILGYYSSVTMVFVIMSTLMGSVFVSVIPKIAKDYNDKKFSNIKNLIRSISVLIIVVLIIGCIIGELAGNIIFAIIFGEGIVEYMYLLTPTIIASIALTFTSFFSSVLISMQENNKVLGCNLIAAFICTFLIIILMNIFGLSGTLLSLTISLCIASAFLLKIICNKLSVTIQR